MSEIARHPAFVVAVLAGVSGYAVMSFLMTATPLSMHVVDGHDAVERALAVQPTFAQAHQNRILGLYRLGRYPDAWDAVDRARAAGAAPPPELLQALAAKMPEPPH